ASSTSMCSVTSWFRNANESPRRCSMFASVLVTRLSTQITRWPRPTRYSQRWEPRNPAPPVTTEVGTGASYWRLRRSARPLRSVLGLFRNIAAIHESTDIAPRPLATTYLDLRVRSALGRPPTVALIAGKQAAYRDFQALLGLFEEIYLRRHYPFRPTRATPLVIDCGANIGIATLFFKTLP